MGVRDAGWTVSILSNLSNLLRIRIREEVLPVLPVMGMLLRFTLNKLMRMNLNKLLHTDCNKPHLRNLALPKNSGFARESTCLARNRRKTPSP